MGLEFKICDKCKGTNISTLIPRLKEIDENATIKIGCHNFCGIGRTKPFAIVNQRPIIALDEDELIVKIKEFLK